LGIYHTHLGEEEVHQNAWTYDEVIFNRCVWPRGKIIGEEKGIEESRNKEEEEEVEKSPHTSTSIHLELVEEVEEALTNKKRRDKEKVLKKKNETSKERKIDVDKAKANVEEKAAVE
jgi:hypothetical protein